jgi:hypothetical protein
MKYEVACWHNVLAACAKMWLCGCQPWAVQSYLPSLPHFLFKLEFTTSAPLHHTQATHDTRMFCLRFFSRKPYTCATQSDSITTAKPSPGKASTKVSMSNYAKPNHDYGDGLSQWTIGNNNTKDAVGAERKKLDQQRRRRNEKRRKRDDVDQQTLTVILIMMM